MAAALACEAGGGLLAYVQDVEEAVNLNKLNLWSEHHWVALESGENIVVSVQGKCMTGLSWIWWRIEHLNKALS